MLICKLNSMVIIIRYWCLFKATLSGLYAYNFKYNFQITFRPPDEFINLNDFTTRKLNDMQLENIPETKFLSMPLDSGVNFKTHISELRKKMNYAYA